MNKDELSKTHTLRASTVLFNFILYCIFNNVFNKGQVSQDLWKL